MGVCLDQFFAFLEPAGELGRKLQGRAEGVEVGECTRMGSDVGRVGGRKEGNLRKTLASRQWACIKWRGLTTSRKTSPTPLPSSSSIAFSSLDTSVSDRTARSEIFLKIMRTSVMDSGGSDAGLRECCVDVDGTLALDVSPTKIEVSEYFEGPEIVICIPICIGTVNWTEGTLSCIIGEEQRPEVDMSEVDTVLTVRDDEDEHVPLDVVEPELELDVFDPEFEIPEPEIGRALEKRKGGG